MVATEYKIAYSEVLEILKHISKEEFNKVPQDMLEMFKTNANSEIKFIYNPNKTLQEQNVSETARAIIAILFRDYWTTEVQKEKILAKQKYDRKLLKKENYNQDNLFKSKQFTNENNIINTDTALVECKESIFRKIFNKLKSIFYNKERR